MNFKFEMSDTFKTQKDFDNNIIVLHIKSHLMHKNRDRISLYRQEKVDNLTAKSGRVC